MGDLLGHAVRFGVAGCHGSGGGHRDRALPPSGPAQDADGCALSAGHLAAILFPAHLRRLYIVRDNDPAGDGARDSLVARAHEAGIEAITLSPMLGDFNDDLTTRVWMHFGRISGCNSPPRTSAASWPFAEPAKGVIGQASDPHGHTRLQSISKRTAPRPSERASGPQTLRSGNGGARLIFRRRAENPAFTSRGKISRALPSRPSQEARAARPDRPWAFRRHEGRDGRGPDEGASHVRPRRFRTRSHLLPDRP
jgi:hypothetical protein